ncbi:MAG TPA: radical SAM protein [Kiritimatiellia bacterium]|nr:radical SAM protein [Kiritimatiellia bacterium]
MTGAVQNATREWTEAFRARAARTRTPIAATLELTRRCNLRCIHCYLGDQAAQWRLQDRELDAAAVQAALSEWADAGCLYLTLTGGEPLLRPDFPEIYRHARELGLVVTVFTNGTLVADDIAALFRECPPRKVEISLYGATPETHDAITGVPGSHARAWAGIRRLQAAGVRVALKTVLMKPNLAEREELERQAAAVGAAFRHDAAIFPCLDGARAPLALRVAPEEAVRADLATAERRATWREKIEKTAAQPAGDRLYACAAGRSAFHADPFGGLSPCLLAGHARCEAAGRAFRDVWNGEIGAIQDRKRARTDTSFAGDLRGACAHCPAFNRLETGDDELESDYMKRTTALRFGAAMEMDHESDR